MELWGVYLAYIGRNLYANIRLRHIRREHAIYACHTRMMRVYAPYAGRHGASRVESFDDQLAQRPTHAQITHHEPFKPDV
jgi:hypothetical protein